MKLKKNFDVIEFLKNNLVPIMFIIICAICIPSPVSPPAICSTRSSPVWAGISSSS